MLFNKVMARARVELLQTRLLHSEGVPRACVYACMNARVNVCVFVVSVCMFAGVCVCVCVCISTQAQ